MDSSPAAAASADTPYLLLVSDDLMFPSRIREGARPLGFAVRTAGTEETALRSIEENAAAAAPAAILVNLTARRYDPVSVIRALKADPAARTIPLLAFAGHVEVDKHEAARAAGADMVAANSSVSMHLGKILPRLLSGEPLPDDADDHEATEDEAGK